ncbi:hypothetical protein QUG64_04835 [Acinetobacter lwoffii]|nr:MULTISPECIES: hypothetical protein [Acinetobacter]
MAFLSAAEEAAPELALPDMGGSTAKAAGADRATHPAINSN